MGGLFQDLRYALRGLWRNRVFAVVTIASLALGIGANTAIFSLVNAVLLRPLTFPNADRLVMIKEDASAMGNPPSEAAPGNYADWKAQQTVFDDMAALTWRTLNITGDGEPQKVPSYAVTANLFSLLGVKPVIGRDFTVEDDQPGHNKVAILSYGLWQRRYGGDRTIVGRDITLNGQKYLVIGVMPYRFQFLQSYIGLWTPAALTPEELRDHDNHYVDVVARMKPGVTLQQAEADIKVITDRIVRDHADEAEGLASLVIPLREHFTGDVRRPIFLLLVAAGLVLLIACANVASLMLSRAASRRKEFALRAALGAGRPRLVRQLLTESILLACCGGALGLLIAWWSFALLKQLIPPQLTLSTSLTIDLPVLGFALAASILTGVIFGLAPALHASKLDLNEALKQAGNLTATGGTKLRGAFVVAQIALALVLLIGAGLLMQTVLNLHRQYSGFQPERLLALRTALPAYKYREHPKRVAFFDQVLQRVRALPGVSSADYTTSVPLQWKGGMNDFTIEGRPPQPNFFTIAVHRQISADYFRTMGIALKEGRYFQESDNRQTTPVAIVNETMARQFWPDGALGKRFKLGVEEAPWVNIVGVVADVRQMGMDVPVKAEMYFPYRQITTHFGYAPRDLVVRASSDPFSLVSSIRKAIHEVDPEQPVANIETMDDQLASETGPRRMGMMLLMSFAGLALVLASVGIYGVLSYFVTQQTREIGVRMALGAQRSDILSLVMRKGMVLAVAGVAIGTLSALALARLMASLLFGISARDPITFAAVAVMLLGVALAACLIPARRATKVDPVIALRYE
ncbi:MAG TPA: ABC transporter permease [Pyrinomonadaceae bacterium]|nr:ABC transporter permease [Pyrinomonadaceae bacterium]